MADTGTGMQAALAITAAWAQKLRTGEGQFIELSMQEVMTMFMRTTGVMQWNKEPARRRGHRGGAPTGMYPCAPGGENDYVHMLVSSTRMWDQLCLAMDRDDLLVDPRFRTARLRGENADALDAEIRKWTMNHEKFEAMRLLCESGVAASAIFDTMDVFHDPHLNARGFIQSLEHPEAGTVTLMGLPIRMSKSSVPLKIAPLLGQDTVSVLSEELGLSNDELEALSRSGAIGISTTAYAAAE
jgi:formyl-CoA transferase